MANTVLINRSPVGIILNAKIGINSGYWFSAHFQLNSHKPLKDAPEVFIRGLDSLLRLLWKFIIDNTGQDLCIWKLNSLQTEHTKLPSLSFVVVLYRFQWNAAVSVYSAVIL